MSAPTAQPDQESPDAAIVALVAAQAAARASFTAQAEGLVAASAAGFGGWYDSAAITAWAVSLAAQVEGLQTVVARTADAYLSRVLSLMLGRPVRPVGSVDVTGLRAGVTHAGAYGRAADVYRWQQSEFDRYARDLVSDPSPVPFGLVDPVAAAVERVKAVADMDVQLADRAQTAAVYGAQAEKGTLTGYRRVIHPERSKGGTCGLCVAASDRLYGPSELKPIHARCECTTLPVLEGADPGSLLNRADLRRLYKEAGGSTHGDRLKSTRYRVDEHGELGPLLTKHGVPVRTERQAKRDTAKPGRAKSEAEQVATLRRLRDGMTPALAKAQQLAKDDPKEWGDYLTKLEDRIKGLDQQLAA